MSVPQSNRVIVHIHSVDEKEKTVFASFATDKSPVAASARPPIGIDIGLIPQDRKLGKEYVEYIGVQVCEKLDSKEFVTQSDLDYWKSQVGNSWASEKTPATILASHVGVDQKVAAEFVRSTIIQVLLQEGIIK